MKTPPQKDSKNVMDRDEQIILSLLNAIDEEPDVTQKDLATRLGVAVGMVNSYLKRVIYKGYVKTKNLERRRLRYLLTPRGIKEKMRLTYEFLEYSYQYIRDIRKKVRESLVPHVRMGKKRVVFYGSGEVAELAYLAVRELGMELIGVIDPDRVGERCVDHPIHGLDWLDTDQQAELFLMLMSSNNRAIDESALEEFVGKQKIEYVNCLK